MRGIDMTLEDRIDAVEHFVLENAWNLHEPEVHCAFVLALHDLLEKHFREVVGDVCWRREGVLEPSCN